MPYSVLLYGSYFCDLVYTGLPEFPSLGREIYGSGFEIRPGASFYTALALRRLGVPTGWACDFGDDLFSRFVLERCAQEGIDDRLFSRHPAPLRRVTSAISFPHERAFVSFADPAPRSPEEEAEHAAALLHEHRPAWLILPHLMCGPQAQVIFAAAHEVGARVYMDCQDASASLCPPAGDAGAGEALRSVDVFAPNAAEALALTGASDLEQALELLSGFSPTVVVKCGATGVYARAGGQACHVPAHPVDLVRDTTGAGDSFNAGFIWAALQGRSLEGCLQAGNICGAAAVSGKLGELTEGMLM